MSIATPVTPAHPYLLENTFRAHDVALVKWMEQMRVDYGQIDNTARNNVPPFVIFASPERAFAEFGQQLVKRGWITGANEEEVTRKLQDKLTAILPLIAVYRSGYSEDREQAGGPKMFYQKQFNFQTGHWDAYQWPTMYRADYNVICWSRYQYTNQHMLSWFETQFNRPGQSQDEVLIPVEHEPPFGTLLHSLKRLSISDTSELEGDGKRMIRTNMSLSLRMTVFRKPELLSPTARVGEEIIRIGEGQDGETLSPLEPIPPARPSFNHFALPYAIDDVPLRWPKTGDATVSVSSQGFRLRPNRVKSLDCVVNAATDAVLLVKSISEAAGTPPVSVLSWSLQTNASAPADLVVDQTDGDGSNLTTAAMIRIPAATGYCPWSPRSGLVLLNQSVFGVHVQGTGIPAVCRLSGIHFATYPASGVVLPSITSIAATAIIANFTGLPPVPHFFCVGGLAGFTGAARAYVVDDAHYGNSTAPNQQSISQSQPGVVISFTPPKGGLVSLRLFSDVDILPTPAILLAFPYLYA